MNDYTFVFAENSGHISRFVETSSVFHRQEQVVTERLLRDDGRAFLCGNQIATHRSEPVLKRNHFQSCRRGRIAPNQRVDIVREIPKVTYGPAPMFHKESDPDSANL